jgi:NAD(P)-dependent dehydrogenase (short-subunit alcohol dehydrogenase family)
LSLVYGSFVAISSVNSAFAHRGLAAHASAKDGITMLVKVAALELAASGIRVNAIAPGIVRTGITAAAMADQDLADRLASAMPLGRIPDPADVADVAVFLVSSASRWITGQTIHADGGVSLRVEPPVSSEAEWTPAALIAAAHSRLGS